MAKKTDKFYSLMNITNGNILSAAVNGASWYKIHEAKTSAKSVVSRKRNWKISQFRTESPQVLDYFIGNIAIEAKYSMGINEIWVKEEDIDSLYAVLALSTIRAFCDFEKQKALFGAFLFNKDPELFLSSDFTSRRDKLPTLLKEQSLGKEFLLFLESFGVLSYTNFDGIKYVNGKYVKQNEQRIFYSFAEIELIERERKDINTNFEQEVK